MRAPNLLMRHTVTITPLYATGTGQASGQPYTLPGRVVKQEEGTDSGDGPASGFAATVLLPHDARVAIGWAVTLPDGTSGKVTQVTRHTDPMGRASHVQAVVG